MSYVIFDNNEGLIGDFLCTVPFMLEYCKRHHNIACVIRGNYNEWIMQALAIPFYRWSMQDTLLYPKGHVMTRDDIVIKLSCLTSSKYCQDHGHQHHTIQGHGLLNGIDIPLPYKGIKFHEDTLSYPMPSGVVIAPFSRTDSEGNKCWDTNKWIDLCHLLMQQLHCPVYVLGSSKYDNYDAFYEAGIIPRFDLPAPVVVNMLRRCKLFVSIDTGIAHLAHLMNIDNHVLLYPNISAKNFAENPNAFTVYGDPKHVTMKEMWQACQQCLDAEYNDGKYKERNYYQLETT